MTSEVAAASTETSRLARVDPMSRGRDGLHVEDMVNFPVQKHDWTLRLFVCQVLSSSNNVSCHLDLRVISKANG